ETATFRIISLPPSPISHPPSLVSRQSDALPTRVLVPGTDRSRGHPRHEFEGKRRANEEKCERPVKKCGAEISACGIFTRATYAPVGGERRAIVGCGDLAAAVDIQAFSRATSCRTVREAANSTIASAAAMAGTMNIAEWRPSARKGSSAGGKLI